MKEAELLDPKNKAECQALRQEQDARPGATGEGGGTGRRPGGRPRRAPPRTPRRKSGRRRGGTGPAAGVGLAEGGGAAARRRRPETPAAAPREDVAKAEAMQNEVARTLNDLQSYSSTREAKVEAGRDPAGAAQAGGRRRQAARHAGQGRRGPDRRASGPRWTSCATTRSGWRSGTQQLLNRMQNTVGRAEGAGEAGRGAEGVAAGRQAGPRPEGAGTAGEAGEGAGGAGRRRRPTR